MITDGPAKTTIAKAIGVTDMHILGVYKGKAGTLRKLPNFKKLHTEWDASRLDPSSKKWKKALSSLVAEMTPVK